MLNAILAVARLQDVVSAESLVWSSGEICSGLCLHADLKTISLALSWSLSSSFLDCLYVGEVGGHK